MVQGMPIKLIIYLEQVKINIHHSVRLQTAPNYWEQLFQPNFSLVQMEQHVLDTNAGKQLS